MKKIGLVLLLLVGSCAATEVPPSDSKPIPVPSGYFQFCEDNPTSPICVEQ